MSPSIPPAGWTLVRTDNNSNSLQLSSYWHVAGASEPASYTWSLTSGGSAISKAAAGTISAYSGVDPVAVINASGGQVDPNSTPVHRRPLDHDHGRRRPNRGTLHHRQRRWHRPSGVHE